MLKSSINLPFGTTAILFDLDDTLHYRTKAFRSWANHFVRTQLVDKDEVHIQAIVDDIVHLDAYGYAPRDYFYAQLRLRYPELPELSRPDEELIAMYHSKVCEYLEREQEIVTMLETLQEAGVPFGIVTNGLSHQQWRKVRTLGFDHFTSCICVSGDFGVRKPDPRIFYTAAECLEMVPERILFVGDSPTNDIYGAHRVNMHTVWIQHPGRVWDAPNSPCVADMTIQSLAELPRVFGIDVRVNAYH